MTYRIIILALTFTVLACKEPKTIFIKSSYQDCTGEAEQKCLVVKEKGTSDWELFYDTIDGFNYEEGYNYVLDIMVETVDNPPADGSSIKYSLVKIISKTKDEEFKKMNEDIALNGRYNLTEVLNKKTQNETYYIEFDAKLKRVSAFTGCNRMSGSYIQKQNSIEFGMLMATKMFCADKMELEHNTATAISQSVSYSIKKDVLTLQDKDGKLLLKAVK